MRNILSPFRNYLSDLHGANREWGYILICQWSKQRHTLELHFHFRGPHDADS